MSRFSPPPQVEDQVHSPQTSPRSSRVVLVTSEAGRDEGDGDEMKDNRAPRAVRRVRPGTLAADMVPPPSCPISDLDSAFQLQEHLASLLAEQEKPMSKAACDALANPPEGVDGSLWTYEWIRRLAMELNLLIVELMEAHCTCPVMKAKDMEYLCAVHSDAPQECSAIDYSVHTLDHAVGILTSNKYFASRISIPPASMKHFSPLLRRLYRILAHAWYEHKDVFWKVEQETSLYKKFMSVADRFNLLPGDVIIMPPEANEDPRDGDEDPFKR